MARSSGQNYPSVVSCEEKKGEGSQLSAGTAEPGCNIRRFKAAIRMFLTNVNHTNLLVVRVCANSTWHSPTHPSCCDSERKKKHHNERRFFLRRNTPRKDARLKRIGSKALLPSSCGKGDTAIQTRRAFSAYDGGFWLSTAAASEQSSSSNKKSPKSRRQRRK